MLVSIKLRTINQSEFKKNLRILKQKSIYFKLRNVSLAERIGSNYVFPMLYHYLKEGTGYPCAGHDNTALECALFFNHPALNSLRAGALVPIGSDDYKRA